MTLNLAALNEVSRAFALRSTEGQPSFPTPALEQVRRTLLAALAAESDSVAVLVGTAGVGKTLLIQSLLDELPVSSWRRARLSFTLMSGAEILRSVAFAFGMPPQETRAPLEWLRDRLCDWAAREQHSLLAIDEAQGLSPEALQTLMGLSQMRLKQRPLLRVMLVGQPELLDLLDAPEVEPFALHLFSLPGFRPSESNAYVRDCMARYAGPRLPALSDAALAAIHQRSQGLPGRINPLCIRLFHTAILSESFEALDADAVTAEADELAFHARSEPVACAAPVVARMARHPDVPLPLRKDMVPELPESQQPAASAPPATPRERRPVGMVAGLLVGVLGCGALILAAQTSIDGSAEQPPAQTSRVAHGGMVEAAPIASADADVGELVIHPAAGPQRLAEPPAPAPTSRRRAFHQHDTPVPAQDEARRKLCEKLLVQVSLGEPLSAAQHHTLETRCHSPH